MTKQQISNLEELLDERKSIMDAFNNKADEVYYNGIVQAINTIGYEVHVDDNNKHKLIVC